MERSGRSDRLSEVAPGQDRDPGAPHRSSGPVGRFAIGTGLVATLFLLVRTRLRRLDEPFWTDEAFSVLNYSSRGPSAIFGGDFSINNHRFFNLLAWFASEIGGESEYAFRFFAVVPALIAVLLLGWYLRERSGWLAVLVGVSAVTFSTDVFVLSRQARGYGLLFLCCSALVVLVDSYSLERRGSTLAIIGLIGFVGSATFPFFGLPFVVAVLVLTIGRDLRPLRDGAICIAAVTVATLIVYWNALDELVGSSNDFQQHRTAAPLSPWSFLTWTHRFTDATFGLAARETKLFTASSLSWFVLVTAVVPAVAAGSARLWKLGRVRLAVVALLVPTFTVGLLTLRGMALHDRYLIAWSFPVIAVAAIGAGDLAERMVDSRHWRAAGAAVAAIWMIPAASQYLTDTTSYLLSAGVAGVLVLYAIRAVDWPPWFALALAAVLCFAISPVWTQFQGAAAAALATPIEDFRSPGEEIEAFDPDILIGTGNPYSLRWYARPTDMIMVEELGELDPDRYAVRTELEDLLCRTDQRVALLLYSSQIDTFDTRCLAQRGAEKSTYMMRRRGGVVVLWLLETQAGP